MFKIFGNLWMSLRNKGRRPVRKPARYYPHQGKRERERRMRQLASRQLEFAANSGSTPLALRDHA